MRSSTASDPSSGPWRAALRRAWRPIKGRPTLGAFAFSSAAASILVSAGVSPSSATQAVALTQGMVIDRSITVRPGVYRLAAATDLATPAIAIRGENITVDFNGAELVGSPDTADPDSFAGVGVLVDGGSRITITNATIRGYRVGILARRSPDLHLTRNDLSYNWKQRLHSGIERESLLDWMSYHHNEKDEWLRYGAAIYLSECDRAEIDHNTAVQGQNGLMVTRSSALKIWNNTFQFLSSVGIGLYRVSASTVMHNKIDWCVRGYSHGFYNRGQDSAGLLMYEQSSNNVVAYNSVTHGGDGLFLWAGQTTMDTGHGGSNDNLFYKNDFSHAPTNGIEATFSRNNFLSNRVDECWHGVWGGYSYDSWWAGNTFSRNTEGIAIEHGQQNRITENTFSDDEIAIRLWSNATQDPNWGYPKNRDTESRDISIYQNTFKGSKTAIMVDRTRRVQVRANTFERVGVEIAAGDTAREVGPDVEVRDRRSNHSLVLPLPLKDGMDAMIKDGARRGRETIIIDEWGPYDWKSPKLWPVLHHGEKKGPFYDRLRVLGPGGDWKVLSSRDVKVTPQQGRVPGEIQFDTTRTPGDDRAFEARVELEYRGSEVVSPRGVRTAAGAPYRFSYSRFIIPTKWTVRFFEYTDAADPVKQPAAFAKLVAGNPIKTTSAERLDYTSGRSIEEGIARDRFALVAEGAVNLPDGDYTLQLISDDGARVWMDDRLLIDAWKPHGSQVDTAAFKGGRHKFRVEYYEIGGFAELRFDIRKGGATLTPHR
jgi:parallel beta-helix repeat protein